MRSRAGTRAAGAEARVGVELSGEVSGGGVGKGGKEGVVDEVVVVELGELDGESAARDCSREQQPPGAGGA